MSRPDLRPALGQRPAPAVLVGLLAGVAAVLAGCGGGAGPADEPAAAARPQRAAQAAAAALPIPIVATPDPMFDGLAIPANAATAGMWGPTQPWPLNGLHAALLPDGRVLTYGTPKDTPGSQNGRTMDLWTPSAGFGTASHATTYLPERLNSFCTTSAWLADGRLMLTGGNAPRQSTLVTPSTGSFLTDRFALADDRWYATMLTLPDGRSVVMGGIDPYTEGMLYDPDTAVANGTVSMTPEIYVAGTGWRSLFGARSREAFGPDHLRASYPRAWVAPDGRVFGISADQMWSLAVDANGGSGAVMVYGTFKGPPSASAPLNVGATSTAAMFAPGRILQVGGNGGYNGDGLPASNLATVVDITAGTPRLTETAPMSFARRLANATVLPDGKVLVNGGTRLGNNGGTDAVYAVELWNPATGTWAVGANAAQIRVYHSAALLLPNGTVLATGGGAPGPVNNQNAEIYYPPNLFRGTADGAQLAPRPVLTAINATGFAHGATLQVQLADGSDATRLVMIANGRVTHAFNNGQRFLELAATRAGQVMSATLPASAFDAPPGYYQVFALDAAGVPSRAVIISLGLGISPAPSQLMPVGSTVRLASVADPAQSVGLDAANLAVTKTTDTPADLNSALFVVRNGLADASCMSLESPLTPGAYLRHFGFRLRLSPDEGSDPYRNDATFCLEGGSTAGTVRLRSKNYPDRVMNARNGEVWIDIDDAGATFRASSSFTPVPVSTLPVVAPGTVAAPAVGPGASARYALSAYEAAGLTFSWDFGDGSAATAFAASSAASHAWAAPGIYTVTATLRNAQGQTSTFSFVQAVVAPATATAPAASGQMLLEPRTGAAARLWVVNPDNNSVSVFDTATRARVAEIPVGSAPRSVARAPGGAVWVVNRDGPSLSVISATTLAVTNTVALPRASQPYGLVFAPNGASAWVALEASGQVARLDPSTGAQVSLHAVGATPRHLAITADSSRLLVSRFITGALPGEGTASVSTTSATGAPLGGEVRAYAIPAMTLSATVVLRHSDRTDTEIQGSGVPNYLGAPAISPDGGTAWVPGKQDNVRRGTLRNGLNLDFQNTVRAISSRISLATLAELPDARIDHDNASVASAAVHDPSGAYLFVALETARQVAVVDAARGRALFRIEVGLAPQALAVSADGLMLYVHNMMARSISVVDLTALKTTGTLAAQATGTLGTVGTERLAANVLLGKQLFYDARDRRLSRDAYMSCATCHHDGSHDGRTWDLTGLGEGLRNTIALRGRAGLGHGLLHWSGNFDEVQDFEGQIRSLAGGTGLMTDAQYFTGTRSTPLGAAKTGVSADLDALAAYVASLNSFAPSPARTSTGALSSAAAAGLTVFRNQACATCHGGTAFQKLGALQADVGTVKPASGTRLGATLIGLNVPTLRDVAGTGPWLHDGSAATLSDAIVAHRGVSLASTDLANLVAFLGQIGSEEVTATVATPPASAVSCGGENATCTLPAGTPATVYYGADSTWAVRSGVSGSIGCNNLTFGDPLRGTVKACRYVALTRCASEGGTCALSTGTVATVLYGAAGRFYARGGASGNVACTNGTFGDPLVTGKACWR